MGTYELRPYQTDLLERVREASRREARHHGGRMSQSWKGGNRIVIIQIPTRQECWEVTARSRQSNNQ